MGVLYKKITISLFFLQKRAKNALFARNDELFQIGKIILANPIFCKSL